MKSLEQVREFYKSQTLDGRDLNRLFAFIPEEDLHHFGMAMIDEYKGTHVPKEFTRENILEQLQKDVAFGFRKALDCRGISSAMMYQVVKMWNWILEEGLQDFSDESYAQYGLPLFKATALKYGFENPIGEDSGNEDHYQEQ